MTDLVVLVTSCQDCVEVVVMVEDDELVLVLEMGVG